MGWVTPSLSRVRTHTHSWHLLPKEKKKAREKKDPTKNLPQNSEQSPKPKQRRKKKGAAGARGGRATASWDSLGACVPAGAGFAAGPPPRPCPSPWRPRSPRGAALPGRGGLGQPKPPWVSWHCPPRRAQPPPPLSNQPRSRMDFLLPAPANPLGRRGGGGADAAASPYARRRGVRSRWGAELRASSRCLHSGRGRGLRAPSGCGTARQRGGARLASPPRLYRTGSFT